MHIKLVVNSFPVVSETFLFNLVVRLESRGFRVSIFALNESSQINLYQSRLKEWSHELDVSIFKSKNIIEWLRLFPYLVRNIADIFVLDYKKFKSNIIAKVYNYYLLKGNPDVVHFAYSGIGVAFLNNIPLIKAKGIKVITSCRGSAEKVKPVTDPIRKYELSKLFSMCDKVHCVSYDMLVGLKKYGLKEENAFVNYPSIDIEYFKRELPYKIEDNKIKLVTTGRLHFQKGYVYALKAMKMLKDNAYDFQYTIIGDGPDKQMMQYYISEFGLEENVIFTGKINTDGVKSILLESDIFILPSLYEGIANAALEAMAIQIPLITTKSGGMEEVIQDKVNGMLVNRFDGYEIFRAIKELLDNPDLRKQISYVSREIIIEKFNIEKQIETFQNEYNKLYNI